jgi:flagellar motility protein MotE (MotC chaperone)
MRLIRLGVIASFMLKAVVLATWWTTGIARAEREEPKNAAALEAAVPPELIRKSRGFLDLLDAAKARSLDLEKREEAAKAREAAMKSLEQLLTSVTAKLEPVAPGGAAAGAGGDVCATSLTRIYASMKPEEAGPILDRLDDANVKAIFGCMKERQIGALLAAMNRERAVALTKAMGLDVPPAAAH